MQSRSVRSLMEAAFFTGVPALHPVNPGLPLNVWAGIGKRLSLPSRFPSSSLSLQSSLPLRTGAAPFSVSSVPLCEQDSRRGRCRILRRAAGSSDTGGRELGYRRPGILFPTGREPCSRLPGDVLCPPVRFFPAVPLPPEKWPPSLKGRAVLCPLSEFYCNFARTTHLR